MPNQRELDRVFVNTAKEIASLSKCVRAKVGAVIVKEGNIVSFGYNGTPSGMSNDCEQDSVTKQEVLHAESNAILKAARSGYSVQDGTLYLTLSPCQDCCKLIIQSGISRVVYDQEYRDTKPIEFLSKFVKVEKYDSLL